MLQFSSLPLNCQQLSSITILWIKSSVVCIHKALSLRIDLCDPKYTDVILWHTVCSWVEGLCFQLVWMSITLILAWIQLMNNLVLSRGQGSNVLYLGRMHKYVAWILLSKNLILSRRPGNSTLILGKIERHWEVLYQPNAYFVELTTHFVNE